jgi:hypothetical protein
VKRTARFLLSGLLAVTMMAGTVGVAVADDGQTDQGKPDGLLARVAQILNIDTQKLKDAFTQALTERRTERQNTGLENLVNKGTLTQEQADQLKTWLDSRPDIPRVGPKGLDALLQAGKITQEQYDAYQAWMSAKPDIPLPQREGPRRQFGPRLWQRFQQGTQNAGPGVSPTTY